MSRILYNKSRDEEVSLNGRCAPAIFTWIVLVKIRSRTSWKSIMTKLRWSAGIILLLAPPGLENHHGLCQSKWTGRQSQADSGPVIEKAGLGSYPHIEPGDVLFIDDPTPPMSVEEVLYSAMSIFTSTLYWRWWAGVSIWTFLLSLWLRHLSGALSNPRALALGLPDTWNMSKMIWQRLSSDRRGTEINTTATFEEFSVVGGLLDCQPY